MLWEMFTTFLKIGAFTFGGGFAMIPIIQEEIVERRGWIDDEEFIDIISIAQSSPGPIAVNSSMFVGYTVKGFPGALISTIGTVLPSFIIILIIANFFSSVQDNLILDKIFYGIRPTVVALIFSTVYRLLKDAGFDRISLLVALISAMTIVFVDINPIFLIITGVVAAIIFNKYIKSKMGNFLDLDD